MMGAAMNGNPVLPPRVITLGSAMRPLLSKLEARMMDTSTHRTVAKYDMAGAISDQLGKLLGTTSGLTAKVNILGDVLSTAGADAEIHRMVGGIEVYLDDLLAQRFEVLRWRAAGSDARALDLLAGVYRHLLTEIRDWLDELVETIADPLAAVKRRGLPTSGNVDLQLTLTLTEAPQLAALHRWARTRPGANGPHDPTEAPRLAARHRWVERNHRPAGKSKLGFLRTVGAVVVGIAIGGWLFGDGE